MQSFLQYRKIGRYVHQQLQHEQLARARPFGYESRSQISQWSGDDFKSISLADIELADHPHKAVTSQSQFEKQHESHGSGSEDQSNTTSPIQVESDGPDDPTDPNNWSLISRSKNMAIVWCIVFTQAWAGAADSLGNKEASRHFHVSEEAEVLETAMYLLAVGTGALLAGPFSESFGRNPVYLSTMLTYMLFVLGSALTPNFGGQVVCRYFVGFFAAATLTINGSSVGDQFGPIQRALVFPVIAFANIAAPVLAPVAGGWISQSPTLGFRWTEWVTLIISVFAFVLAMFFLPESYGPLLVHWKAEHLRKQTSNPAYTCDHESKGGVLTRLKTNLPLPVIFFTREPVIMVLGTYLILLYIIVFSFLQGFDFIFTKTYHFSTGLTGTAFLAIAAGATFSTLLSPSFYFLNLRSLHRQQDKEGLDAQLKPESRLWPAIIAAPFLPISLFWLGWTNYSSISPWSGLGACFLFGYSLMNIYVSSYQYILDSYGDLAASALGSITTARYWIAGGMVMASRPMYSGIGVHWTLTLLGCLAVVLMPAPGLFYWFGGKVRERSKFAH